MRTRAVCEGSPFRNNRHQHEVGAQFSVMRELGLTRWDPTNVEAVRLLAEALGLPQQPVTVYNAETQFAPKLI